MLEGEKDFDTRQSTYCLLGPRRRNLCSVLGTQLSPGGFVAVKIKLYFSVRGSVIMFQVSQEGRKGKVSILGLCTQLTSRAACQRDAAASSRGCLSTCAPSRCPADCLAVWLLCFFWKLEKAESNVTAFPTALCSPDMWPINKNIPGKKDTHLHKRNFICFANLTLGSLNPCQEWWNIYYCL